MPVSGFLFLAEPAQRVRRTSKQVRCSELRADIGFRLSYAGESVVIDIRAFCGSLWRRILAIFQPSGCNRTAAHIIDRVNFRKFFTDVGPRCKTASASRLRPRLGSASCFPRNHCLGVQSVGQIDTQRCVPRWRLASPGVESPLAQSVTLRPDLQTASARWSARPRMLPRSRWADATGSIISRARRPARNASAKCLAISGAVSDVELKYPML